MKKAALHLFLLLTVFISIKAQAQAHADYTQAATTVKYRYIGTFDQKKLNNILTTELAAFLDGSPMPEKDFRGQFAKPKYDVKLYEVIYRSYIPEFGNTPTIASGLVAIPDNGLDSMPVISYQHGTVFSKTEVPSHPDESMETKLMLAQYASQGYIVIGADYFGMGYSDLPNAYLIKNSTEQACVDMLLASRDVLRSLKVKSGPLFLHGWSQGGWNNMVFLRKLESLNISVTAATTASAPIDALLTIEKWINNYQPGDAVYLPACATNFLFSYEYYAQMPGLAKRAIKPEYYQVAKDFFEFKTDWSNYMKVTEGKNLQGVLEPAFRAKGNVPAQDPFWASLDAMEAYKWRCQTPLLNYYGEVDEVLPPYVAKLAEGFHAVMGSFNTKAVYAGAKADHRATYVYSVVHAKAFYEQFLKNKNL